MSASNLAEISKASTGILGLDSILGGGLPQDEIHLLQGGPGTGKTTAALQFLLAGVALGEKALFITFAQTEAALRKIAASHGWTLDGVDVQELTGSTLRATGPTRPCSTPRTSS